MKEAIIALSDLRFSSNRTYGGDGEIKILAEDIKRNGLINPITVKIKPVEEGEKQLYEVIAGRRRVNAVTQIGWKSIPCRVLEDYEIERAEEIEVSENINRLAMHPLDEAEVFNRLLEVGRPIQELAQQYDRTVSAIWQRVQLLTLTDGIKEMFRDGKISLHAAAMLKSLDAGQQLAFCDKYIKSDRISEWDVKGFIAKVRHDKLYSCIAGKECAGCKKRTFYNDKALFPELSNEDDLCLDHECYMIKWRALLSARIMEINAKSKGSVGANIIACDDDGLAKIFGKSITVDGTEYKIIKLDWSNRPDEKPTKTAKPCFQIDIEYESDDNETGQKFTCVPMYLKEPAKKKDQPNIQQRNPFMPMVKLLEMPEPEQAAAALFAKYKPKQSWETCEKADEIDRKVKSIVFNRLIDIIVEKPDDDGDIDLFLDEFLNRTHDQDIIKKFAGSVKIPEIKKLSVPKMFAALYATTFSIWGLPDFDSITSDRKCVLAEWAGMPRSQLKEMYKEELKALMPEPAVPKEEKPDKKKKPAVKKTAAKSSKRGMIKA